MWVAKLSGCRRVHAIHFLSDGRLVVVGGANAGRVAAVTSLAGGTVERRIRLTGVACAVRPDGGRLVLAGDGGRMLALDLTRPDAAADDLPAVAGRTEVLAAAFSPDGRLVATVDAHPRRGELGVDHLVVVRAADTGAVVGRSDDLLLANGGLAWRPDGKRVAVFGGWQTGGGPDEYAPDGRRTRRFRMPNTNAVEAVAYSPDGRRLVALDGWMVWRFEVGRPKPLPTHPGGTKKLTAAAFLPDGHLLTAGTDGVVRTWDADGGRELAAFAPGVGPLHALAVAPDGLTVAAAGPNVVVAWDA